MAKRRPTREKQERASAVIRVRVEDIYGGVISAADRRDTGLALLAASIARHGLLSLPVVRRNSSYGRYALVCGGRRVAACRMLGMKEIDALLIEGDEAEATACFLEEHACRQPMTFLLEAQAVQKAGEEAVIQRCVLSEQEVRRRTQMLALPECVKALLAESSLSLEQAYPLLAVHGEARQLEAASIIAQRQLTPGQARRMVFGERGISEVPPRRRAVRTAMEEAQRIARRLTAQGITAQASVRAQEKGLCIQIVMKTGDAKPEDIV